MSGPGVQCPACGGLGRLADHPCRLCDGTGGFAPEPSAFPTLALCSCSQGPADPFPDPKCPRCRGTGEVETPF